jgi:hypothetical protein
MGLSAAINSPDRAMAQPHCAAPSVGLTATALEKYVAKTNVMMTVGKAELAQS